MFSNNIVDDLHSSKTVSIEVEDQSITDMFRHNKVVFESVFINLSYKGIKFVSDNCPDGVRVDPVSGNFKTINFVLHHFAYYLYENNKHYYFYD